MTPERQVSPKFFPFEFTPLYVGMPSVADYTKPTALGGGYVEPIGFNTLAPRRKVVSKSGNEVRPQRRDVDCEPIGILYSMWAHFCWRGSVVH
jgi:hypothetical protein